MSDYKIKYKDIQIRGKGRELIGQINSIIEDYQAQGYSLTLRQVYYQLVSRALIENSEKSYKSIGELVSNGRLAGLIDWKAIEDRTRNLRALSHWKSPREIIESAALSYHIDLWIQQPYYCEVWVEKDALIGIVEQTAHQFDVPCFSCRGYTSQSEMWEASLRFIRKQDAKKCVIIHLGDHDPSGIDMTRDIKERLAMFGAKVEVERIALNMNQVRQYNPPPNPAKITDTRAAAYIAQHGAQSWELDALDPSTLAGLISGAIETYLDRQLYEAEQNRQEKERAKIRRVKL